MRSSSNIRCPTCSNEFNVKIEEEQQPNNQISHNVIIAAPLNTTSCTPTVLPRNTSYPVPSRPITPQSTKPPSSRPLIKQVAPSFTNPSVNTTPKRVFKTTATNPPLRVDISNQSINAGSPSLTSNLSPIRNHQPTNKTSPVNPSKNSSSNCPLHQVPFKTELHVKRESRIGRRVQRMRSRSKKRVNPENSKDRSNHQFQNRPPNNVRQRINFESQSSNPMSSPTSSQKSEDNAHEPSTNRPSARGRSVKGAVKRPTNGRSLLMPNNSSNPHDLLWSTVFWLHGLCLLLTLADAVVFLRRRSELAGLALEMSSSDWLRACGQRDLQLFMLQLGTLVLRALEATGAVFGCLTGSRLALGLAVLIGPLQLLVALAGLLIDLIERVSSSAAANNASHPEESNGDTERSNGSDSLIQSVVFSVLLHVLQWYAFGALVILCVRQNGGLSAMFEPINQWCSSGGYCPPPLQSTDSFHAASPYTVNEPQTTQDQVDLNGVYSPPSQTRFARPEVRRRHTSNRSNSFDCSSYDDQQ
jgi:hypothetical protein